MKLYKFLEPNEPIKYWSSDIQVEIPKNYIEKPVRAFWVSNVANIDLPNQFDLADYKKKLANIIKTALEYKINVIYFQVRTNNDAYYHSKINPTSRFIVGSEGSELLFDPLKWIIEEAKKHNIEIHAWANPYRVSMAGGKIGKDEWLASCSDLNLAKRRPDLIVLDDEGQIILNPAKEEVKKHVIDSMVEIIENYDVAGIHFDDYFYPYRPLDKNYDDTKDFLARENQDESLSDFRERHVDEFIKGVYEAVKAYNPKLEFGVSPFAIWKTTRTDPRGSNNPKPVYESGIHQHANSYRWVKEEWVDYVVPQIYWDFAHEIAAFADMTKWWVGVCEGTKVKLYVGFGAYRLGKDGQFKNKYEIVNQIKYANQYDKVSGNVFFTYNTFITEGPAKDGMELLKKMYNGGPVNEKD